MVREKLKQVEEKDQIRNMVLPLNGEDIIQIFEIKPGKEIGLLKKAIKDAILDGDIENNKEQAILLVIEKAKKFGLKPKKNEENKI